MKVECFEHATLYQGDCLDIVDHIVADGVTVDGLVSDPPYASGGIKASDRQRKTTAKYFEVGRGEEFMGDGMDQRVWTLWMSYCLRSFYNIMSTASPFVLFVDWRQLPALTDSIQMAELTWRGVVPWDKTNARPRANGFRQQAEFIVWGSKGDLRGGDDPVYLPGAIRCPAVASAKRLHQTEKPLAVMDILVQMVQPGGLVLDPFMGGGSTAVACMRQSRRFIGIVKSPRIFDIACRRMENETQEGAG